jgi:GNAT superfamily N-acetyltransferase
MTAAAQHKPGDLAGPDTTIRVASKVEDAPEIRALFWEYLRWANERLNREYELRFDIHSMLEEDMQDLDKFMPPHGRLLLADRGASPAGIACLKALREGIGEVKRMYVRPQDRGAGLGRALLQQLLHEAAAIGYGRVRLDSARFMTQAHRLYHTFGFREIPPYEGSEIPVAHQSHWVFMELDLVPGEGPS